MARTYKRDSRGRFAGGGGSSSRGGGRKSMQRGTNRLTRVGALELAKAELLTAVLSEDAE